MKHHHPFRLSRHHYKVSMLIAAVFLLSHTYSRAQEAGSIAGSDPVTAPGPVADPGSGAPFAVANTGDRPKNSRTVIDSDDGATFENATSTAEFTGHVVVNDPQFDLTCDKLHVLLGPNRKGLSKVIATGSVIITQEKKNDRGDIVKSIGKCGKATYDATTGDVTMEEWPQIQQGINNQVATQATTIMILNAKGRSRTIGGSRTMIVDQGTNAVTP